MSDAPKFRIYPSIGVARIGNGPAEKGQVVFSPEVPWANLFETKQDYLTAEGAIKKQAQRFYVYECGDDGVPIRRIDASKYSVTWSVEVANKKPFWYDFNNSLDLSVVSENQNVSPNFAREKLAPGISAARRNPNVLNQGDRVEGGYDYRKELINRPSAVRVGVDAPSTRETIRGEFPFCDGGGGASSSRLAASMDTTSKSIDLGTVECDDDGSLIFYAADGVSASLNPSDLNTDFADNSNWYDDICDGRVTAEIVAKKGGATYTLDDARSAAWIVTAPPDYAPQIQPISTLFDLISGAANDTFSSELSLVFPLLYRLYRMQWVNLGDFLAPSFKETIDKLTLDGKFKYIYQNDSSPEGLTGVWPFW